MTDQNLKNDSVEQQQRRKEKEKEEKRQRALADLLLKEGGGVSCIIAKAAPKPFQTRQPKFNSSDNTNQQQPSRSATSTRLRRGSTTTASNSSTRRQQHRSSTQASSTTSGCSTTVTNNKDKNKCNSSSKCKIPTCNIADYAPPEWDALLSAAKSNDAIEIRHLVTKVGVPPNHSNTVDQSGLHIAAIWGNVDALQELLKYDTVDVNCRNKMSGATPLHSLMMSQKGTIPNLLKCMDLLLENGADPTLKDFFDKIPIDYYAGDVNSRVLAYKLQPQPSLFRCIQEGDLSGVEEILQSTEYQSRTFEELFTGKSTFAFVLDLILEETTKKEKINDRALLLSNWVDIMDLLLNDAMDNANDTFLCDVISGGGGGGNRPPILRVCSALETAYQKHQKEQEPSRISQDDRDSNDPHIIGALLGVLRILSPFWPTDDVKLIQQFHNACRKNDLDMVVVYLDVLKLNPNTQGTAGMTALHFAARSGCTEVVQYLLADPTQLDFTIRDDRGKTSLEAARINQRHDIVALLQDFFVVSVPPGE